jgi:hypothetical protein
LIPSDDTVEIAAARRASAHPAFREPALFGRVVAVVGYTPAFLKVDYLDLGITDSRSGADNDRVEVSPFLATRDSGWRFEEIA